MKRLFFTGGLLLLGCSYALAETPQLTSKTIEDVLNNMTLEEKATVVVGETAGYWSQEPVIGHTESIIPGVAGTTQGIKRLGVTQMVLADGPAGVRVSTHRDNDSNTYYTTGVPVASNLACSWDTEILYSIGKVMGNEAHEYGVDIILAPAINIMRNPLCGRNFEYYSEDPFLTGKLAAAYINGAQSEGVGTSLKHFAANNQETNRNENDAIVSQRALREIYLKGFEIAIKEGKPWTVMSSYNRLNGPYTQENRELLTDVARGEWGFDGVVMTDWIGKRNTAAQIHAGNDLMEPGSQKQTDEIIEKVRSGELSEADLDTCVRRILQLIVKTPRFNNYPFSNRPDLKSHSEIARKAAADGIVMLKNEDSTLPLSKGHDGIALFGAASYQYVAGGTGSGDLDRKYVVNITEGLQNHGFGVDEKTKNLYERFRDYRRAADDNKNAGFGNPDISRRFIDNRAEECSMAIVTISRNGGEGSDRKIDNDFNLTPDEYKLIKDVCDAFHLKGKKVVVLLNIFGVIETASWKNLPDAILCLWEGGQEGGNAVADVLSGQVNPSGKLTMTFPISCTDHPSTRNFPLNGHQRSRSWEPKKEFENVDYTLYNEGIYVGYRYFDKAGKEVAYPFGHGLSYTDFEYAKPKIKKTANGFDIEVSIKNIGNYPGREVAQLYVSAPEGELEKPLKELKGFAKTRTLKPGESQTVNITVSDYDLASYDTSRHSWISSAGDYTILVGTSSNDIRIKQKYRIGKEKTWECNDVLNESRPLDELSFRSK